MHAYVLLVATAAIVSAVCAGGILARDPRGRASRRGAALLFVSSYWAISELAWNLSGDRATALAWVRASAPGWLFHGPVVLQLFLEAEGGAWPRLRRLVPPLYVASFVFVAITWFTPWMIRDMVQTPWGWGYVIGPAHPVMFAVSMLGILSSLVVVRQLFRKLSSPAERRQKPWLALGIATPICAASVTDVLLPCLGIQVPRLATSAMATLGAIALWNTLRFGHSLLTPGTFAEEILATLPDGVALLHPDGRIRSANPGLAAISGHPAQELVAMGVERLLGNELGDVPGDGGERTLLRASGDSIPVSIATSELRDRQGYLIGRVLVVRDLRDVAQLRSRLVMSARLAAVGELAAGIAHEINNPIAFVRSNLSQLASHWKTVRSELEQAGRAEAQRELLAEGEELIEESVDGVDRAAEIVRGVKGFSHAGHQLREPTDLNQLLEDVLHMAAAQLRGRASVERYYVELPPIACVPQEIKQVFLNLIVNAGQAISDGGTIRIATEARGEFVTVKVEDDGCGIAPEHLERIFDPFFTTKRVGEGTGLGLGIAYHIIRSHGGEIQVESELGRGSRFRVRLPV
ncbi:MAG TPA: ATP-binding protein [Myxococcota bacterium]|jgi:PAS domain S-box-containing protein